MNTILCQKNSVTFTSLYPELSPKTAMPPWFEDFPLLCYFQSDAYACPESNGHWSKLCRPVLCIVFSENTSWYVVPVDEEKRLVFRRALECEYFFMCFQSSLKKSPEMSHSSFVPVKKAISSPVTSSCLFSLLPFPHPPECLESILCESTFGVGCGCSLANQLHHLHRKWTEDGIFTQAHAGYSLQDHLNFGPLSIHITPLGPTPHGYRSLKAINNWCLLPVLYSAPPIPAGIHRNGTRICRNPPEWDQ